MDVAAPDYLSYPKTTFFADACNSFVAPAVRYVTPSAAIVLGIGSYAPLDSESGGQTRSALRPQRDPRDEPRPTLSATRARGLGRRTRSAPDPSNASEARSRRLALQRHDTKAHQDEEQECHLDEGERVEDEHPDRKPGHRGRNRGEEPATRRTVATRLTQHSAEEPDDKPR